MTPVIFKLDNDGGVFAAFPALAGDMNAATMSCYAHVGQHGAADMGYVRDAKPAKPDEYAPLHQELVSIGYDDLVIRRRMSRTDYLARREQVTK